MPQRKTYCSIKARLKEEMPAGCERPRINAVEALLCEYIDSLEERLQERLELLAHKINRLSAAEHQE
jgi:hypothetical protein